MSDDLAEEFRAIISQMVNMDQAVEKLLAAVRSRYWYEPEDFLMRVPDGPALLYATTEREGSRSLVRLDRKDRIDPIGFDRRERLLLLALVALAAEEWAEPPVEAQ